MSQPARVLDKSSQRASRLRSFHCHRVLPESETQPTFATRPIGKIDSPVTIRQAQAANSGNTLFSPTESTSNHSVIRSLTDNPQGGYSLLPQNEERISPIDCYNRISETVALTWI